MKNSKYRISLISLALILLLALTALLGLNTMKASASGTVTVSGSNVFTASGTGASVSSHAKGDDYYTMFSIVDGEQNISYRRNLAYTWFEGVPESDAEDAKTVPHKGWFNMKIGFADLSFKKYVITFESQVYNKIKDNKSLNYIMFFPVEGANKVYVHVTQDKDDTVDNLGEYPTALDMDEIEISFNSRVDDVYGVVVDGTAEGDNASYSGSFKNVGGNYAKASTSSSNPLYPLIFSAEFGEGETKKADMVLYSLNNQGFKVSTSTSLTVTDDQPPVLCLEDDVTYFTPGSEIDVSFAVIDVLRSSPSSTVNYYVLTVADKEEGKTDFEYAEPVNGYRLDSDEDIYLPESADLAGSVFSSYDNTKGKFRADMLVSVYYTLKDISSSGETCDVYLDWYIENKDDYLVRVNDTNFMVVAEDKQGVQYNYGEQFANLVEQYQNKVDEAAKDLSAGSSSYIYLPSAKSLFKDNATSYEDMKISIYYYHDSQSSSTNLATNSLSLNVSRQGSYVFTFYATDAAGNDMIGDNGEEFGTDEIWDMFKEGDSSLPWFHFNVGYTGVSFEETPGMQSTAYVGTSYSGASFKINGVSDSYDTLYRLFHFDSARYYRDHNKAFTYEEFIDNMDKLFENAETRVYFSEILSVDGMEETDEEYEGNKDYAWKSSGTSFTPQVDGLYYIRAEVTDKLYNSQPVTCSLAVVASEKAKTLKGENRWLQNNIASVVLLGVAALALIGIILLLAIKPKDKGDIDVQFERKTKKKSK
ncbi:MAG: hypothetical protein K2L12_07410 [Clostridia bacterium]|nr:hypothetical protein [Clostridia bacterium]